MTWAWRVKPVEDGLTFETNARIKARFAARATGLPSLADDSGIEVEALGGGPGVWTRRYAGPDATDADNNAKLLRELADVPGERRGARYVCVLALALPDASAPGGLRLITRRGTARGRIAVEPRGSGGFGYDPLFEPARERGGGRTFGQYGPSSASKFAESGNQRRRTVPSACQLPSGVGRGTPEHGAGFPAAARMMSWRAGRAGGDLGA